MALRVEHRLVTIEIPARPEFVSLVRLLVSSLAASRCLLGEQQLDDLKLAVSEATTNAIEAYGPDPAKSQTVRVHWTEGPECLEVGVEDDGGGFDPDRLVEHPPVTDARRLQFERGLGIPLLRTLVEEVRFEPTGPGTLVRMRVVCAPAPAGDEL